MAPDLQLTRAVKDPPALRVPDAALRTLFEDSSDGILFTDASGRVLDVNPRLAELTGFERAELRDRSLWELFAASQPAAQRSGAPRPEPRIRRKDGSTFSAQLERRRLPDGSSLILLRDHAERRRPDAPRREPPGEARAEQLESLGRLVGVVAHDFTNMLTVILTSAEACLHDPRTHPHIAAMLREIREASVRSTALARQLLSCAARSSDPDLVEVGQ